MIHNLLFRNPAPLFFLIFVIACLTLQKFLVEKLAKLRLSAWFAGISIGAYALVLVVDAVRGGLLWHDEANILSIAAAYLHGQPMYHAPAAPELYSLFYGPVTFLVYVPFLAFSSDPLTAMRLVTIGVVVLQLALMYRVMRSWVSSDESLALLALSVAVLLPYPDELMGLRGDSWLLLCFTAAVYLSMNARKRGWPITALAAGALCGLAVDAKLTVVPVACVVLGVLYRRQGAKAGILSALSAVAAAGGLFLLPRISLAHYGAWLMLSRHQKFLRSTALENLSVAAMLLLPLVAARTLSRCRASYSRYEWTIVWAAAIAVFVCVLTGSKTSAGPWHLWPVLPLLLVGAAYELRGQSGLRMRLAISISFAAAIASLYFAVVDIKTMRPLTTSMWKANEAAAKEELFYLAARPHGKNLSMGYGEYVNDYRTDLRFELPMAKQDYFFDENEVVEGIKEGLAMPRNVEKRLLGCEDDWLVPHGEPPFSTLRDGALPSTTTPYIFPEELRTGFASTHEMVEPGDVYDRWACKADRPQK